MGNSFLQFRHILFCNKQLQSGAPKPSPFDTPIYTPFAASVQGGAWFVEPGIGLLSTGPAVSQLSSNITDHCVVTAQQAEVWGIDIITPCPWLLRIPTCPDIPGCIGTKRIAPGTIHGLWYWECSAKLPY